MVSNLQQMQQSLVKLQKINDFVYNQVPMADQYEQRKKKYYSQFEKTITVETTDPILYGICNIDRFQDKNNQIQIVTTNMSQEIMKAKLKGNYPEPT